MRRAITDPDEVDEDLGNISFGSTGAIHESRDMGQFSNIYIYVIWDPYIGVHPRFRWH